MFSTDQQPRADRTISDENAADGTWDPVSGRQNASCCRDVVRDSGRSVQIYRRGLLRDSSSSGRGPRVVGAQAAVRPKLENPPVLFSKKKGETKPGSDSAHWKGEGPRLHQACSALFPPTPSRGPWAIGRRARRRHARSAPACLRLQPSPRSRPPEPAARSALSVGTARHGHRPPLHNSP